MEQLKMFDEISKEMKSLNLILSKSEETRQDSQEPKIFIFTSIDLVNSTSYKQYDNNWPSVFSEFFGIIESEFRKRNENLYVWKYVGDEVLFYEEANSKEPILKAPSETFKIMELCEKLLYERMPQCKNLLYLKATVWIAPVRKSTDELNKLDINNVIPNLSESLIDFIGEDIDEGFRIAKFSSQNKLVLDSKLAYILFQNSEIVNKLCDYYVKDRIKIVAYKRLKGIWNNRLYPIIWYSKSWSNLDSMFLYDEYESSEIAKELKNNNYNFESISKLKKILNEVNEYRKLKIIDEIINSSNNTSYIEHPTVLEKMVELHCVAICFDETTKSILIAKRKSDKRDPSHWEFGCTKATRSNSIKECLEEGYREEFNIGIDVIMDHDRTDCQPVPLTVYSVNKNGKIHKGIIFLAKVIDKAHIRNDNFHKHSEIRWISEEDINDFNEEAIPDFKDTLTKAFKYFKS